MRHWFEALFSAVAVVAWVAAGPANQISVAIATESGVATDVDEVAGGQDPDKTADKDSKKKPVEELPDSQTGTAGTGDQAETQADLLQDLAAILKKAGPIDADGMKRIRAGVYGQLTPENAGQVRDLLEKLQAKARREKQRREVSSFYTFIDRASGVSNGSINELDAYANEASKAVEQATAAHSGAVKKKADAEAKKKDAGEFKKLSDDASKAKEAVDASKAKATEAEELFKKAEIADKEAKTTESKKKLTDAKTALDAAKLTQSKAQTDANKAKDAFDKALTKFKPVFGDNPEAALEKAEMELQAASSEAEGARTKLDTAKAHFLEANRRLNDAKIGPQKLPVLTLKNTSKTGLSFIVPGVSATNAVKPFETLPGGQSISYDENAKVSFPQKIRYFSVVPNSKRQEDWKDLEVPARGTLVFELVPTNPQASETSGTWKHNFIPDPSAKKGTKVPEPVDPAAKKKVKTAGDDEPADPAGKKKEPEGEPGAFSFGPSGLIRLLVAAAFTNSEDGAAEINLEEKSNQEVAVVQESAEKEDDSAQKKKSAGQAKSGDKERFQTDKGTQQTSEDSDAGTEETELDPELQDHPLLRPPTSLDKVESRRWKDSISDLTDVAGGGASYADRLTAVIYLARKSATIVLKGNQGEEDLESMRLRTEYFYNRAVLLASNPTAEKLDRDDLNQLYGNSRSKLLIRKRLLSGNDAEQLIKLLEESKQSHLLCLAVIKDSLDYIGFGGDLTRQLRNVLKTSGNPAASALQGYTDWRRPDGCPLHMCEFLWLTVDCPSPSKQFCIEFDSDPGLVYFYDSDFCMFWGRYNRRTDKFEWIPESPQRKESHWSDRPSSTFKDGGEMPNIPADLRKGNRTQIQQQYPMLSPPELPKKSASTDLKTSPVRRP